MSLKPTVLIIEDEQRILDFLKVSLENDYNVKTAITGADGLIFARTAPPDIILLDLGLPDIDGMEVLKDIRSWSQVPIIVVSARQSETEKVAALDKGADDYVIKPFGVDELRARIRRALRRGTPSSKKRVFKAGGFEMDFDKRAVTVDGKDIKLTPNEFKIVHLLCENAGMVLTHDKILKSVWGPYEGDTQILRVNMANIRRKIEENPADPKYILTQLGVGYRMVDPEEC